MDAPGRAGSQARVEAAAGCPESRDGAAPRPFSKTPAEVFDAVARGEFDLALVPELTDDAQRASDRYRGLAGAWFDVLLDAAAAAPDPADKRALYAELQRLWAEALPGIPLYQELRVEVAPRALEGVPPSPMTTR